MIGAIYILNHKGDTLAHSLFDQEIRKGAYNVSPVNTFDGYNFFHLSQNGLWYVGISRQNTNCAMVFEYLCHIQRILLAYIEEVKESKISSKADLIVEIFEDTTEMGLPQLTDVSSLKNWITQKSIKNANKLDSATNLTNQITGHITWRKQGIHYKSQAIYLDIREKVNLLMSADGKILDSYVEGVIRVNSQLSGMPECKMKINEKFMSMENGTHFVSSDKIAPKSQLSLDDCVFHQCVKLGNYESDRIITFTPPDGTFDLMKFLSSSVSIYPLGLNAVIQEYGSNRFEMKLLLKSNYKEQQYAKKIEVNIPISTDTTKVSLNTSKGRAKYKPSNNAISWRIRKLQGMKEVLLVAEVEILKATGTKLIKSQSLTQTDRKGKKSSISVNFEVGFSCCGLQISYLKVHESKLNYGDNNVAKWIRNTATNGSYEFRI